MIINEVNIINTRKFLNNIEDIVIEENKNSVYTNIIYICEKLIKISKKMIKDSKINYIYLGLVNKFPSEIKNLIANFLDKRIVLDLIFEQLKIKHKLAFYNFRKWCESDSLFYKNYNYIQYSKCIDLIKLSKVNENLELSEIEKKFVITNR